MAVEYCAFQSRSTSNVEPMPPPRRVRPIRTQGNERVCSWNHMRSNSLAWFESHHCRPFAVPTFHYASSNFVSLICCWDAVVVVVFRVFLIIVECERNVTWPSDEWIYRILMKKAFFSWLLWFISVEALRWRLRLWGLAEFQADYSFYHLHSFIQVCFVSLLIRLYCYFSDNKIFL